MGRRRRRKKTDILDIIPPLVGLIFLCVFFVPGFKRLLGSLFFLAVCFTGWVIVGLIIRALWRKRHPDVNEIFPPPPPKPSGGLSTLVIPTRQPPAKPDPTKDGWSLPLLKEIEWHRFEQVVAAYSRELGYDAKKTRTGADGGWSNQTPAQPAQKSSPATFQDGRNLISEETRSNASSKHKALIRSSLLISPYSYYDDRQHHLQSLVFLPYASRRRCGVWRLP